MHSVELNPTAAVLYVWFTQHVDDPFIVSSKQPYGVFEQQHESCVDHPVGQLVGVGLKERKKGETMRLDQDFTHILCL